jgi:hypothetical protein
MSGCTREEILAKIKVKGEEYARYQFTPAQDAILKTFFDLVYNYDSLEDYYQVCVLVLKQSMAVDCRLYLTNQHGNVQLVQASDLDYSFPVPASEDIELVTDVVWNGDTISFPIYFGGLFIEDQVPSGVFQVLAPAGLSEQEQFFLHIYANRIGVSLNNKVSACQNVQHIKFVNGLVADMEHNVIIPNMYFKHLFNKLRKKIAGIDDLEKEIVALQKSMGVAENEPCKLIVSKVADLQKTFAGYHKEMEKHHNSCSLFLESLFRKDHFESGKLILRTKKCFVEEEIIDPQLEHFAHRFHNQGIVVRRPSDMRDEEIPLTVDIGLLAQVYANLFSNALKYAAVTHGTGESIKIVAYGREYTEDCFGPGLGGVKFNVFSTGPHISDPEIEQLFDEGFRGENAGNQSGKGHGLAFIRQVVEIHGGRVSYEKVDGGNNFCFYLPLSC